MAHKSVSKIKISEEETVTMNSLDFIFPENLNTNLNTQRCPTEKFTKRWFS